jgi:hypothetical protein
MTEPTQEQIESECERAHAFAISAEAVEAMARGLVESPSWDYDGALDVEKEYYRRFARQCLLRSETVIATALTRRAREANEEAADLISAVATAFGEAILAMRKLGKTPPKHLLEKYDILWETQKAIRALRDGKR